MSVKVRQKININNSNGKNIRNGRPLNFDLPSGISISDSINMDTGIGVAARSMLRAARAANLDYSLTEINSSKTAKQNPYVNIPYRFSLSTIGLNGVPDQSLKICKGQFNILNPFWEVDVIPIDWLEPIKKFDEIWAPSNFIYKIFKNYFSNSVEYVPLPLNIPLKRNNSGLIGSKLNVYYFFDFDSYFARKNPFGAIDAFQLAFPANRTDVQLLIKARGRHDHYARKKMKEIALRDERIRIIDHFLPRAEVEMLMSSCDVFLSLHRSEGFGYGAAEALAHCKPVIATDYGGTTDFISPETGFPVSYRLTDVKPGEYIAAEGAKWAEPDLEEAATYLREIYDDYDSARSRAIKGYELLRKKHSFEKVGAVIEKMISD